MKNRLRRTLCSATVLFSLLTAFYPVVLPAQQGFFTFNYPGPTTIPVGPDCNAILAGNMGTPFVSPTTPSAAVVLSEFDPDSSHFTLTTPFLVNETAHVIWYVTDNKGHSAYFDFYVTFVDNTPPAFDLTGIPTSLTVASAAQTPLPPVIPVSDNCWMPADITVTITQSATPPICQAGSFTRTWTATDPSGNSTTFVQTINVEADTASPVVTALPQNGLASCTELPLAFQSWLSAQMTSFKASDVSGPIQYSNNAPSLPDPPGCLPPLTITFTATDACGLTATETATYSVLDTLPPIVLEIPRDTVVSCSGDFLTAMGDWLHRRARLRAADSCTATSKLTYSMKVNSVQVDSLQVIEILKTSLNNPCSSPTINGKKIDKVRGFVPVDFIAADGCGNSASMGTAYFVAIDTTPPGISGVNMTENCGGNDQAVLEGWINQQGKAMAIDLCSEVSWVNFSWETSNGQTGTGLFGSGPYPVIQANNCQWYADVTFRTTDGCGNGNSIKLRFQIIDTEAPKFTGLPAVVSLSCPAVIPVQPSVLPTDNCSNNLLITYTRVVEDSICNGNYNVIVTWSATDDCGLTGKAVQRFEVRDNTPPVFTVVPPNRTIACDTFAGLMNPILGLEVVATDACSAELAYLTNTVSQQNPNPLACDHYTYIITRTFTALDNCGNTQTASQVIQIIDDQAPVFSGFTDTTLICSPQLLDTAYLNTILPRPTATDACSGPAGNPVLQQQYLTGFSCGDSYTLVRVWRATDICGKTRLFTQNINIEDTIPPSLKGVPVDILAACNSIPPVPALSTITATDNCDEGVDIVFKETEIRNQDVTACDHWSNYMIKREWTATDNCGNSKTYTQHILVQDNEAPLITSPKNAQFPNTPGQCGAQLVVPSPLSVYDQCSAKQLNFELRDTSALTSKNGDLFNTPVDTVTFQWTSPNMPLTTPVTGTANLQIILDKINAQGKDETFNIIGEDGSILGVTQTLKTSCVSSSTTNVSISAALLNEWLSDGQLTIRLAPNGVGGAAINAFCNQGRVYGILTYTAAGQEIPITIEYAVDNGPRQLFQPGTTAYLDRGIHTLAYYATDCAGNQNSATAQVRVDDVEPPALTPPAAQTVYVSAQNCSASVKLPFPVISDNCDVSGALSLKSAELPLLFYTDPNAGWTPVDTKITLLGLVPNAVYSGKLRFKHWGDFGDPGQFFKVLDENNVQFTTTDHPGPDSLDCTQDGYFETVCAISPAQINAWAADGATSFTLRPNRDFVSFPNIIKPCTNPPAENKPDGLSRVQVEIEYTYAVVNYEVFVNGQLTNPIKTGLLSGNETSITLDPGTYIIRYSVQDGSGIQGQTTFQMVVRDTIAPAAKCKQAIVYTNPSGALAFDYVLTPQEVNNNSQDNCTTALSYSVSPSTFNCNQSGNLYPVTLTVTDAAGNKSSCSSQVRVETQPLSPTAQANCAGGTLQLFANAPQPGPYTYQWQTSGYSSVEANPVFSPAQQNMSNTWTLRIRGVTGCEAVGTVTPTINTLPNQPELSINAVSLPAVNVCAGNDVVLSTVTYPGVSVQYFWYAGSGPGNAIPLDTTLSPSLSLSGLPPGPYSFFLVVQADGCLSPASNTRNVAVTALPKAEVLANYIGVCTGESISLCSSITTPDFQYNWSGPNAFKSSLPCPPAILNAGPTAAGDYTLVITKDGCSSLPAVVNVKVNSRPDKPAVFGSNLLCVGDTLNFITDIEPSEADRWVWRFVPSGAVDTTSTNFFTLPGVTTANAAGNWQAQAFIGGCVSDWSDNYSVTVQAYPVFTADYNKPLCQGESLMLTASLVSPLNTTISYQWQPPSGQPLGTKEVILKQYADGAYTLTATTLPAGCATVQQINVTTVTPPSVTALTNTVPTCSTPATTAQLQAVTAGSTSGDLTYFWKFGASDLGQTINDPVFPLNGVVSNGLYYVYVQTAEGCKSNTVSTNVVTNPIPPRPVINSVSARCEGDSLLLTIKDPYGGANVVYRWKTPSNNIIETVTPQLKLYNLSQINAGEYSVIIQAGDCASPESLPLEVIVNVIPNPPSALPVDTIVCAGTELQLITTFIPGAEYIWQGPPGSGFSSSQNAPIIKPVQLKNKGLYKVMIKQNGCPSAFSDPIYVDVKTPPQTPIIMAPDSICYDIKADTLFINPDTSISATNGAQYQWFIDGVPAPGAPSYSLLYAFGKIGGINSGVHIFQVRAIKDVCVGPLSSQKIMQFDYIPDILANAGTDFAHCTNKELFLNALTPSIGTGRWSAPGSNGIAIVDPYNPKTKVLGSINPDNSPYSFIWTLSNGACRNYDSDTVAVTVENPEIAVARPQIDTCGVNSLKLSAIQGIKYAGYWEQPQSQATISKIENPADPNTTVTGLIPGQPYVFSWNIKNTACGLSSDTTLIINHRTKFSIGDTMYVCNREGTVQISFTKVNDIEHIRWYSPDNSLDIQNPFLTTTNITNLKFGPNLIILELDKGFCEEDSRDTVVVNYVLQPTAQNDTVQVPYGGKSLVNVLKNDIYPADFTITLKDPLPSNGKVETLTAKPGQYTYQPDISFLGTEKLYYKLCNANTCDNQQQLCADAFVVFNVDAPDPDSCIIPTLFTPNHDGVNDVFTISCLLQGEIADSEVMVFNQYGDQVFHASPYNNDWDGRYNGEQLPAGTYYTVIKLSANSPVYKNFLLIQY